MLTINVQESNSGRRINGSLNGKTFNVEFSEDLYQRFQKLVVDLQSVDNITDFDEWTLSVQALIDSETERVDIITSSCKDLVCNNVTGKYYLKTDSGKVSKKELPETLVAIILESVEKGIDATPIIKAWTRFLRNPNFTSVKAELFASYITTTIVDDEEVEKLVIDEGYTEEKAIARATYNDVAITQEGLIVAKKYARLLTEGWEIDQETNKAVKKPLFKVNKTVDQFSGEVSETTDMPEYAEELTFEPPVQGRGSDAFFCGERKDHIIKVGEIHKLESWDQVNTNDYISCKPGLHVGGLQYVQSYRSLNCQLLDCFVDPAEIGALCDLYRGDGAIRVKEYFIYGATEGRTKGIYHSSKYAAIKDAEWEALKQEAIELSNKKLADQLEDKIDVN